MSTVIIVTVLLLCTGTLRAWNQENYNSHRSNAQVTKSEATGWFYHSHDYLNINSILVDDVGLVVNGIYNGCGAIAFHVFNRNTGALNTSELFDCQSKSLYLIGVGDHYVSGVNSQGFNIADDVVVGRAGEIRSYSMGGLLYVTQVLHGNLLVVGTKATEDNQALTGYHFDAATGKFGEVVWKYTNVTTFSVVMDEDNNLYALSKAKDAVLKINSDTGEIVQSLDIGSGVNHAEGTLIVANEGPKNVYILYWHWRFQTTFLTAVSMSKFGVIYAIEPFPNFKDVSFILDNTGNYIVAYRPKDKLVIIDAANGKILGQFSGPVGGYSSVAGFTQDNHLVAIRDFAADIIDIEARGQVHSYPLWTPVGKCTIDATAIYCCNQQANVFSCYKTPF